MTPIASALADAAHFDDGYADVVEAHVERPAAAAPSADPITVATLRDHAGITRVVRILGGALPDGRVTRLAGYALPRAGLRVRGDLREPPAPWSPATPPATFSASALPARFFLGSPSSRDLGAAVAPELDVALRVWPRVACTSWRAAYAGPTTTPPGDDAISAVYIHDDTWPAELIAGALAQTVLHVDADGHLRDADIHINAAAHRLSRDGAVGTADLRAVLVHELGHALGLGHSLEPNATMAATYAGGVAWRSLEGDDRAGVCALYPGKGIDACAVCPEGFLCIASACERLGDRAVTCAPCERLPGACAAIGDSARCIDLPTRAKGQVCAPACATTADCGPTFDCLPTTAAGDLQCVPRDACASGPFPCKSSLDCPANSVCHADACVTPSAIDTPDAAQPTPAPTSNTIPSSNQSSDSSCGVSRSSRASSSAFVDLLVVALVTARKLRRRAFR